MIVGWWGHLGWDWGQKPLMDVDLDTGRAPVLKREEISGGLGIRALLRILNSI
jgi:hypothetical protein